MFVKNRYAAFCMVFFGMQVPQVATAQDRLETEQQEGPASSAPAAQPTQEESALSSDSSPAAENEREPAQQDAEVEPTPYPDLIAVPDKIEPGEPPSARERGRRHIEEVIVTAQRREESLTDVPISITVLSQEQISNANITNASDLATYTPSLSANTLFGAETASFAIRGFVQDIRTTASVATYFAEVVAPRGQTLITSGDGAGPGELFDLQNVQVLKGPQGTLFGRNSTGGAVLLVPRRPADVFGGYAEFSIGDYGLSRQEAVLNLPVHERFKLRVGIDNQERDGYLNNVTRYGTDALGNVNYTALRVSGVWDISDRLENYTIVSYLNSETANYTAKLFDCNDDYLTDVGGGLLGGLLEIPAGGAPAFTDINPYPLIVTPACQRQLAEQEATGNNGFYDVSSSVADPLSLMKQTRVINALTWRLTDEISVKNILAYAQLYTEAEQSIFGSNFRVLYDPSPDRRFEPGVATVSPDFPTTDQDTWVAELQVQGSSFDARLDWQGGVYHENSQPDGATGFRSQSLISCDPATISGDPAQADCLDPTAGQLGSILDLSAATEYTNSAVYGQWTFHMLDQLSATVGTRYTWDSTEAYGRKVRYTYLLSVPQTPIETITTPKVDSQRLTGFVDLSYKPTDTSMTYIKYSQGYRQGGTNTQADPGLDTYDPEHVSTYELGAKLEFGGFLPGRFSAALFYNDFTDMQLKSVYFSSTSGGVPAIFNAGKSEIIGAEVEATLLLHQDLTLLLSYSHLETELIEQENRQDRVRAAGGSFAAATYIQTADVGDPLPYSPDHRVVATLNYRLPLPPHLGDVRIGATYAYTGNQQVVASSASPYAKLDPYSLFNANLNWSSIFGLPLDLAIFGTNLGDEEYLTYLQGGYYTLGIEAGSTGQPRMVGMRLKYRFGDDASIR
jgi:iron complex outermembrane recepter protein